ncbi:MAG: hypothetical protein ACKVW3_04610 [Phycisphaerales bacterium]
MSDSTSRHLALLTACVLAGCAASSPSSRRDTATPRLAAAASPAAPADQTLDRALEQLVRAAASRRQPDANADPGNIPGIEPGSLTVISQDSPDHARANRSLDSVIDELAVAPARDAAPPPPLDPEAHEAALRRYATGRAKLLDGDLSGAIADLKQAATLDPNAPEPQRELAEAYLLSGASRDAEAAFRAADERGDLGPRGLEVLARAADGQGRHMDAARYLARAARANPERADPLLAAVIQVRLGSALASIGFIRAGLESTTRALTRAAELSASTRYGNDYGTIFRRRADLWRSVGDAHSRLGEHTAALRAYEQAASLPAADGTSLVPRQVHAALASGQPERAAIVALRALAQRPLEADAVPVLRHLAARDDLRPRIVRALSDLREGRSDATRPVRSSLARAQASLQPPADARRTLRDHLLADPGDARSLTAYFGLLAGAARADAAAELVALRPIVADAIADALLAVELDPDGLAAALVRARPAEAGRLAAAHVLAAAGLPRRAIEALGQSPSSPDAAAVAALLTVACSAQAGTLADAAPTLGSLATRTTPTAIRAHARALTSLQRYAAALERLRPLLDEPAAGAANATPASTTNASSLARTDDRIDDLVLAATLAMRLAGDDESLAADSERWLLEARRLDSADDRPVGPLLDLYSLGGAKADPSQAAAIARDLRLAFPDSRSIRIRRAADALRRGLFEQAQSIARELADEDPSDGVAIGLLSTAWEQRIAREGSASIADNSVWIDRHLAARPGSPALVAAAAVLALARDDKPAAEAIVRKSIDRGAGQDVHRLLERLLRDRFGRAAEADALALARFDRRALLPGEALEFAEVHLRAQRFDDARNVVASNIQPGITLNPDQLARLIELADSLAKHAVESNDSAAAAVALTFLDTISDREGKFGPELHDRRLTLIARAKPVEPARLLDAAARCADTFPQLKSAPFIRAASLLVEGDDAALAPGFVAKVADLRDRLTPELAMTWFRIVARSGSIADARVMISRLHAAGLLTPLMSEIQPTPVPADARAESAYVLGQIFATSPRAALADAAYELALEFDPNHPWACNNLGYSLADRGLDVDRAADLLERAFKALPDQPAIIDSLGWLRYKQARLNDTLDPESGTVVARGAVSLLQAAAMTDHGQTDPTILNHLADALWLVGRGEEALRYWSIAERVAQRELDNDRPDPRLPPQEQQRRLSDSTVTEYRAIIDSTAAKQAAARANLPVRVAPQYNSPDPQPADHH